MQSQALPPATCSKWRGGAEHRPSKPPPTLFCCCLLSEHPMTLLTSTRLGPMLGLGRALARPRPAGALHTAAAARQQTQQLERGGRCTGVQAPEPPPQPPAREPPSTPAARQLQCCSNLHCVLHRFTSVRLRCRDNEFAKPALDLEHPPKAWGGDCIRRAGRSACSRPRSESSAWRCPAHRPCLAAPSPSAPPQHARAGEPAVQALPAGSLRPAPPHCAGAAHAVQVS